MLAGPQPMASDYLFTCNLLEGWPLFPLLKEAICNSIHVYLPRSQPSTVTDRGPCFQYVLSQSVMLGDIHRRYYYTFWFLHCSDRTGGINVSRLRGMEEVIVQHQSWMGTNKTSRHTFLREHTVVQWAKPNVRVAQVSWNSSAGILNQLPGFAMQQDKWQQRGGRGQT